MNATLGKLLYAAAFCVALPLGLAAWAVRLDEKYPHLPAPPALATVGWPIAVVGAAITLRAMGDLWRRGGGLPMNAFPPPRLVDTGVYRWLPHPIYAGCGALGFGLAAAARSGGGLWIVAPVLGLAMVALVIGYERIDLQRRFGRAGPAAWLSLPPAGPTAPTLGQKFAALLLAFTPWLAGYEACTRLAPLGLAVDTMRPFERTWPVWEWTAVFYLGAYAWTALAPFVARSQSRLRDFTVTALWGTAFIVWCFLVSPFVSAARPVDASSAWGALLLLDRLYDTTACAFPSFHVFWAFVAADVWGDRLGRRTSRIIAALIAASCVTTGVHSLLDVIAGLLVYLAAAHRAALWAALRRATERVANSWHDWRIGPVRIINHGAYVAGATVLGLWLAGSLLGPHFAPAIIAVALCSLLGAGLWGQWLEASSQLARPFGYFGGLFGGCAGLLVVQLWRDEGWYLAGAFAVAAPVIQAVGRLRCLVQGCCHGRPADAWLGIRYHHPLSRVCKLAKLDGVPVHPTPLYSIVGNLVILGLLARLWIEHTDLAFIMGAYLILSTCARFVEEGYRGEPQTARWAGLPIYQWLAIGCLFAGLALTTLPAPPPPAPGGGSFAPLLYALPLGLLVWLAMGVDFPESPRRMSRLT
jgi:prolipoprotein diacylglyceryltransferase/protein-S-isoprenylcysteine O-methyltransferase Ste14